MNTELNNYLSKVEGYLSDIGPSERASIILEIKAQVEQSNQDFPDKTIHQVLNDLGEPSALANHYRINKGLKTVKKNKPFSFFKFCLIVSLTMFGILILTTLVLTWKFTPLFELDETNNRITVLGGLIDVNGKSGKVKIMDSYQFVDNNFTNSFEGSLDIIDENFDEIVVNFTSGVLNLSYNDQNIVRWSCKLDSPPKEDFINRSDSIIELDFEELSGISCDVSAPSSFKTTVDAKDARVTIAEPLNDIFVELSNGDIFFKPNPEFDYKYELESSSTTNNYFNNSDTVDSIEINLSTKNGSIIKQ